MRSEVTDKTVTNPKLLGVHFDAMLTFGPQTATKIQKFKNILKALAGSDSKKDVRRHYGHHNSSAQIRDVFNLAKILLSKVVS